MTTGNTNEPGRENHAGRLVFFLASLGGGGAERVAVNLLKGMAQRGVPLDLVLAEAEGPYLNQVPKEVRLVNLGAGRVIKSIIPLTRYLRRERPSVLLSHLSHANVAAVIADGLARTRTRLVLVEHVTMSAVQSKLTQDKFMPLLAKRLYPRAEALVGVSNGVARDLEARLGFAEGKVRVIYNPVVGDELLSGAKAPLDHPWFRGCSTPVFLAAGRLAPEKDFLTLIKAFAFLRKQRPARLVILGEGGSRAELETTIAALKITEDVSMPGFVANPYAYMSRASAFVLSSRREALPTVLIEAMACGCPVVATDCPSGPREILEMGVYGPLVPAGDAARLTAAMLQTLDQPLDRDALKRRAMEFSVDRAVREYLNLVGYR